MESDSRGTVDSIELELGQEMESDYNETVDSIELELIEIDYEA